MLEWNSIRDFRPKHYQLIWVKFVFNSGVALVRYHEYSGSITYHVHQGDRIIPESQVEAWQPATLPI